MTVAPEAAPARQGDTCRAGRPADSLRAQWRHKHHRRKKLLALGLPTSEFVDAQPARDHVQHLRSQGMGWERIAAHAGVNRTVVEALLYGHASNPPSRRLHRDNARKLLATKPDTSRRIPAGQTPAIGARRRLQSLVALGWTARTLAAAIGMDERNLGTILHGDRPILDVTAAKILAVYSHLWDKWPPDTTAARRARLRATRNGWAVPAAWDDFDDPEARPATATAATDDVDPTAVHRLVTGQLAAAQTRPAERIAAVAELTARGMAAREIAEHIGMNRRSVVRLRGRAT